MSQNRHVDRRYQHEYLYHSRSDAHSVALCLLILEDLLDASSSLRAQAEIGLIAYGINVAYRAPSGKSKNLDLALGTAEGTTSLDWVGKHAIQRATQLKEVRVSCEAKSVMTEHKKSQPRVYDELSSSHEIVHASLPNAIAAGVTVVNASASFVSPLRQTSPSTLYVSEHRQPYVTESMVNHLRGLAIRDQVGQVGFDAYATIVIDCDNRTYCRLVTSPPAPDGAAGDSYETFVRRIAAFYEDRFGTLND